MITVHASTVKQPTTNTITEKLQQQFLTFTSCITWVGTMPSKNFKVIKLKKLIFHMDMEILYGETLQM